MNLYEISNDLKEIEEFIEIQGDDTQQSAVVLDAVKEALSTKADGVAKYIRNEETTIEGIDSEIKRLRELKAAKSKRLENFKAYVIRSLEIAGVKKIETSIGKMTMRNYPIIKIECAEDEIPVAYKKIEVKEIVSVDKNALKKAIKSGNQIPGVDLVDNLKLSIK